MLIRAAGIEPIVIEYLQHPPKREQLATMIADAGLTVREAIREKGTPYAELGQDNPDLTDSQLLDAIIATPTLINSSRRMANRLSTRKESALPTFPALQPTFPALQNENLRSTDLDALRPAFSTHKSPILILYGSLREVSYSRLLASEVRRLTPDTLQDVSVDISILHDQ